ncbi:hypothetical protein [Gemmata sp.]|uniref:hypothetical protein n=1 Tax=Gemmata sp. TaxID=1914242 RepID=UPI003F6EB85E
MTDIDNARQLFQRAGLAFPPIPEGLAGRLKKLGKWSYSTRPLERSPYALLHYVEEVERAQVDEYAVLAHCGHGVNSYAIHYYVVHGPLRMFLQLAWGGVYSDPERDAAAIRECFSLAGQIVLAVPALEALTPHARLTIVGSDCCVRRNHWSWSGNGAPEKREAGSVDPEPELRPAEVLTQVLQWLARAG